MKIFTAAEAITSRMSVRAFTKTPVSKEIILKLLNISARAPSGTNTQPWKVYVVEGNALDVLCEKVCAAYDSIALNPELAKEYQPAYDYYPTKGLAHTLIDAVKMAGAYMASLELQKAIKTRCMPSIAETSRRLTRQFASSLLLIKSLVEVPCSITVCSYRI